MTEVKKGTNWKLFIPLILLAFAFGYFMFTNLTTHTVEPLNIVAEPLAGVTEQAVWYIQDPTRIIETVETHKLGYSVVGGLASATTTAVAGLAIRRIKKTSEQLLTNKETQIHDLITTQTAHQANADLAQQALATQLTEAQRRAELAEEKTLLTTQLLEKDKGKLEEQVQEKIREVNTLNRTLAEKYIVKERVVK